MKTLVLGLMPKGADSATHLAAGPWCFCGQEQDFPDWEKTFQFAPEPLADPRRLQSAARAAQTLCVRLVPEAAAMLAKEPAALPPEYWQILLAPWLIDLASQLVDRALRAQAMLEAWKTEALKVALLPEDLDFDFQDEQDFTHRGSLGVAFNHWLLSRMLELSWPDAWSKEEAPLPEAPGKPRTPGFVDRLWQLGRGLNQKLAFPKMKGMTPAQALALTEALAHPCKTPDHSLDLAATFNFAADLDAIPLGGDFSRYLRAAMPRSLRALKHKAPKKSAAPRLRIASIACHESAAYRQELAYWRASGNRIGHCQHGGNYGQVETPCAAAVTEYSQDVFFTWGWSSHGCAQGNFVPLPSPQLSAERDSWAQGGRMIFVGAEMAAYGYRLDSRPTPLQFVAYRQAKAAFFAELGQNLQEQTLYRPYFPLAGTLADWSWLRPRFPSLKLCEGALLPQIQRCRLLVLDHHGTTLLEALAAGIPFIAYWERAAWPLTPECDALLDLLEAAEIWHPSPQAAARKCREIWGAPGEWWHSPQRELARAVASKRQALSAPEPLPIWKQALSEL